MKFAGLVLLYLALGVFAKNVFDFKKLGHLVKQEQEKRDGKNVFDFNKFGDKVKEEQANEKRDGKNVFDFSKFGDKVKQEQSNEKRDGKNVFDFKKFGDEVKQEQSNKKRDAMKEDQVVFGNELGDDNTNLLQSMLPQFRDISIFAGYIRDNKEINHKTELIDESMLIIAPTDDSIINKLNGLKPWEFPKALDDGENEDEIINSNLNYFIANHITLNFNDLKVDEEHDSITVKLLCGKSIDIVHNGSDHLEIGVDGNKIPVELVKQVDNGYIFIIDDTLVKPK